MSTLGVSLKNNKEQQELVRLIKENNKPIILCTGKAGTGKTFASLLAALDLKFDHQYRHILYGRNPISIGKDMGALPGGVEDKYNPYMGPLYDNLEAICRLSAMKPSMEMLIKSIECMPISFLRGRSFIDSIIIIDEAQNLDLMALKTILTRVGNYSKVILLASENQIDDPIQRRKDTCDFIKVKEAIEDLSYVGVIELTQSMRSPWCVELDNILGEIK